MRWTCKGVVQAMKRPDDEGSGGGVSLQTVLPAITQVGGAVVGGYLGGVGGAEVGNRLGKELGNSVTGQDASAATPLDSTLNMLTGGGPYAGARPQEPNAVQLQADLGGGLQLISVGLAWLTTDCS